VLEDDLQQQKSARTEAQEKVAELQSKVQSLTMKDRDTKEALALAKSTIHQRDEDLELARKTKVEDEDKLQKSMTLLKTTRKQILRLEKEKQEVSEELEQCKVQMAKINQEAKTASQRLTTQQTTMSSDLARLQAVQTKMAQDKEKLIQEKEQVFDQLQMKQAEFESSQTSLENVEHEMREYRHQLEEARDRVTMLEEEATLAKRLADSKVAESEGLRRKTTELEKKLDQVQAMMKTRNDSHRAVLENLQQEVEETKETLGLEVSQLRASLEEKEKAIKTLEQRDKERTTKLDELQTAHGTHTLILKSLQEEVEELKGQKRNLELELVSLILCVLPRIAVVLFASANLRPLPLRQ